MAENIFVGLCIRETLGLELTAQIVAERLCRWQEHTAVADGIAFHEVEITVGVVFVVIVQTVAAQHSQQCLFFHALIGDIGQIHACGVALVFDVKSELCAFHRRGQIVHVFHHQVPVALRGIIRRVLQCLYKQGLICLCVVAGKFSNLIGLSTCCKFVCDG